jgi:Zn-dependent peptidase ImmA (M78 family)
MSDHEEITELARQVRGELGLSEPPVEPAQALGAYQLSMPIEPLEEILAAAGLSEEDIQKIDAMLDLADRCVFVRDGMHDHKKNWSYLHELGHHVLPWHRDLLYRCSILRLPPRVQKLFEREADQFAAEVLFFGSDFVEEALALPFGLVAPMQLASGRYNVSLHAAFMRYVEQNPHNCCLLVFSPSENEQTGMFDLKLKYYVGSQAFRHHIPPRQVIPANSELGKLFNSGTLISVFEHEVRIGGRNLEVYQANSFTNGYALFTLMWDPRPERSGV